MSAAGSTKLPQSAALMPGVGGILFLLRGTTISLSATHKLARVGCLQFVPRLVAAGVR